MKIDFPLNLMILSLFQMNRCTLFLVLYSFAFISCQKKAEVKKEADQATRVIEEITWPMPSNQSAQDYSLMNQTFSLSNDLVQWSSETHDIPQDHFKCILLPQFSVKKQHLDTFTSWSDLPNFSIVCLTEKTLPLSVLTNSKYKAIRFGVIQAEFPFDKKETPLPEVLVIAPDNKVCWQGSFEGFSTPVFDELYLLWTGQ